MSSLLIISHTKHYTNKNGSIVGWGSTVTEINHLATIFDDIFHIAVLIKGEAPSSSLPYIYKNIHFVPLSQTGGKGIFDKLKVIWSAPKTVFKVFKYLKKVDVFQLRAPTGIGVYLIPIITLFSSKKGWFKYAGNWIQESPPLGYAMQRWWLKRQKRLVTINGRWENQPKQCLTFENPCLSELNRKEGDIISNQKLFNSPYSYCFVGRLEDAKGVRRIIEAFLLIENKNHVSQVHLIGDGSHMDEYKSLVVNSSIEFVFHGFLKSEDVFEIYKKSHFFLLPSDSEGFPKVVAEAINFGCIPIVSDVSSVGQYVKDFNNGFLINPNTSLKLKDIIEYCNNCNSETLKKMQSSETLIDLFTYQYYLNRIKIDIL